ncbi:hypothetical protein H7J77_04080 [Mycolicibacillus parakoreensis]|uniref:Hypervirulence associated protein TUDOR domain-containing protein n=1 Tax=Mycolicibacillus parakoreensis TaxID=1069221 RepID=A0ABY3U190_9MYCO|nr:hypothetical protein [Mycolicibacillus parakoreensis]MCV7314717.1 hypothetical protein [Mycolicibacillus parakoreensis]ULN53729.1 hypothetical protein MIU77_05315 [Mycolicibacillus parakoreensis]
MAASNARRDAEPDFKVKDPVYFNYRSAHDLEGRIVGVAKKGTTSATTTYEVMPFKKHIHPGEKVPIHRTGAHLRHRATSG